MKLTFLFLLAVIAFSASLAVADVKLPRIISNNMVLQADMAAPIWGTASPDEKVVVQINGQTKETTADKDGKWKVNLDPQKPGGPFEMKVNAFRIENVLVGQVWHASGQSNMRFAFRSADTYGVDGPAINYPNIRYFQLDPWHANGGEWAVANPRTTAQFSAVALYFAVELHEHLKQPVGIIDTSVSGALIQTFISPAALKADPALDRAARTQTDQPNSGNYDPMIAKIIPYGIGGVIWSQGEGNRDYPVAYQTLFPGLINDWRKQWGQGDFPFLFVQLANFRERRAKPFIVGDVGLREAQAKTLSVPNTAMVVAIDLAKPSLRLGADGALNKTPPPPGYMDVMNVHFPNKKPVGQRLALAARALAYNEKIEYSGPMLQGVKFEDGNAVITFTHAGGGLESPGGPLKGFVIAGQDKQWVRAEAEIRGDTIVVHSPRVTKPVAVRYAYEENPECNLYNKAALPAAPFRTDAWEQFGLVDGK